MSRELDKSKFTIHKNGNRRTVMINANHKTWEFLIRDRQPMTKKRWWIWRRVERSDTDLLPFLYLLLWSDETIQKPTFEIPPPTDLDVFEEEQALDSHDSTLSFLNPHDKEVVQDAEFSESHDPSPDSDLGGRPSFN